MKLKQESMKLIIIAFMVISFFSCQAENCDSIISIKVIEKPEITGQYYGFPVICLGLFIKNSSNQDTLKINGDSLLYYYNEFEEKTFLRKSSPSKSNFEIAPNSNGNFCLFLDKKNNGFPLNDLYDLLISSTIYLERAGKDVEICKN